MLNDFKYLARGVEIILSEVDNSLQLAQFLVYYQKVGSVYQTKGKRTESGAPVATNKERRPSVARERRGRETVSAPG